MMKFNTLTLCLLGAIFVLCGIILYMYFARPENKHNPTPPLPTPQAQPGPGSGDIPQTPIPGGNEGSPSLVLFWMEGCGHCKNMMQAWGEVKRITAGKVNLVEMESKHPDVAKFGITGFPTIRLYPGGFGPQARFVSYSGDRSVQSFMKFLETGGNSSV